MLIQKISGFTGKINVMDLDVTEKQLKAWEAGEGTVQDIFEHLSAGEREFLMTGVTPAEWDAVFGNDDHDYEVDDL